MVYSKSLFILFIIYILLNFFNEDLLLALWKPKFL